MSIWSALMGTPTKLLEPAPATVTRHIMKRLPPKPHAPKPKPQPVTAVVEPKPRWIDPNPWKLSPMQWQVLTAVALSKTTRHQMARTLNISAKTMDTHLSRIRERMNVQTTAAAVAAWLRVNMERDLEERRAKSEAVLIARLAET